MVHIEDLAFIHGQGFDAVLVGVSVDRFLKRLTQNVLTAFGVSDEPVNSENKIVRYQ